MVDYKKSILADVKLLPIDIGSNNEETVLENMRQAIEKMTDTNRLDSVIIDDINMSFAMKPLFVFSETEGKGADVHGIWKKEGDLQFRKKLEEKGLVSVGDRVVFGKYAGTELTLDGKTYLVMAIDDILGVL